MKYFLKNPFEFAIKGEEVYVLSRNSLDRFLNQNTDNIDRDYINTVLQASRSKSNTFTPFIFVYGDDSLERTIEEISKQNINIVLNHDGNNIDIPKNLFAIFIHTNKSPYLPDWFDYKYPSIHFFFKMNYRYKSSVFWDKSGRPCPNCIESLWNYSLSESYRKLIEFREIFFSENYMGNYIDKASFLEVYSTIQDAIYISNLIDEGSSFGNKVVTSEILNRTTGETATDIFPVYPRCIHEGFVV